jgi:hypothetical protein
MNRIDTRRVSDRRRLRFETIDAMLADADALAAAERDGQLVQMGNWTLGTAINHLAVWAEFAFTGTPLTPPWYVRAVSRLLKKRFLTKGLSAGVNIPGIDGGTLGTEPTPTDLGLPRLHEAMDRLRRETPEKPNALFGPLTREEWTALQLRHAELHLSFFKRG